MLWHFALAGCGDGTRFVEQAKYGVRKMELLKKYKTDTDALLEHQYE